MEITPHTIKLLPVKPTDRFIRSWYAHHGAWQEYSKVYYPGSIYDSPDEELCVTHGCYFYLDFAIWCKDNFKDCTDRILKAISAKLIMNNDLSYVHDDVYCIWFPDQPSEETCRNLIRQHPNLVYQVACVCCQYGYNHFFKELEILPEEGLLSIVEYNKNQELIDYISNAIPHKGLWRILCDTDGMIKPAVPVKRRSRLECESLNLNEIRGLYLDKDYHSDKSCRRKTLYPCDMSLNFNYYDPLRTGVVSDISAIEKINKLQNVCHES